MTSDSNKKSNWENSYNVDWYENISVNGLNEIAIKGGLDSGCDIDVIFPYLKNTASLIEPGAGYGRAIKRLIDKGYSGKIYALERSKVFIKHLNQEYSPTIKVIEADTLTYQPLQRFDAIIGMWAHIAEFPIEQQPQVLKHLRSWLNDNGMIFLDTLECAPLNATASQGLYYEITTEHGIVRGHYPTREEMADFAKQAGLNLIKSIPYKTTVNRDRVIHILSL
jgi:phospholipid N-methyltransferase